LNDAEPENTPKTNVHDEQSEWGKWLFRITLVASLVFIWWLVIYDHGVVSHH